jgi:hypothetical protein
MNITWNRRDVLLACKTYAPLVTPIEGIDSAQLLAAMAEKESTMGFDCEPRYEQRYDEGGEYATSPTQQSLLRLYGRQAAMSYGPWQIMLVNATGYSPDELNTNLQACARATITFLNKQIAHFQPTTVANIGQIWNGGHIFADVPEYVALLEQYYAAAVQWLGGL